MRTTEFDRVCSLHDLRRKGAVMLKARGAKLFLFYNAGRPFAVDPAWTQRQWQHPAPAIPTSRFPPVTMFSADPLQTPASYSECSADDVLRYMVEIRGDDIYVARKLHPREVLVRWCKRAAARLLNCVEATARNARTAWLSEALEYRNGSSRRIVRISSRKSAAIHAD